MPRNHYNLNRPQVERPCFAWNKIQDAHVHTYNKNQFSCARLGLGLSLVASKGVATSDVQTFNILISVNVRVQLRRGQFRTIKSKLYSILNFSLSILVQLLWWQQQMQVVILQLLSQCCVAHLQLNLSCQLAFKGIRFNHFDGIFLFPDSLYFRGSPIAEMEKFSCHCMYKVM